MNVRSFAVVSMMMVLGLGAVGCSGANDDAAGATDTSAEAALRSSRRGKSITLGELKHGIAQWSGDEGCSFTLKSDGGTLSVSLTGDDNSTASIDVSESDDITVLDKADPRNNDVSTTTYRVAHVGVIKLMQFDDAYYTLDLVPESGESVSCQIDM